MGGKKGKREGGWGGRVGKREGGKEGRREGGKEGEGEEGAADLRPARLEREALRSKRKQQ